MMNNIKWDLLQPEDIEVRVGNKIKDTDNISLLLYQDSRCTARNLNKQFGAFGWQIDYKVVGDQIYGTLSIWDEDKKQWVSKSDTGDKSNISEDKGQSSDILKRCAVRWGFGTELYTAPKIVVPNDGYNCSGYKVSEIQYNDNREITSLTLVNRFGKEVFNWNLNTQNTPVETPIVSQNSLEYKDNLTVLTEFCAAEKNKENVDLNKLTKFYKCYKEKMNTWNGKLNIQQLYSKFN